MSIFDESYHTFSNLSRRPADWDSFFKKEIESLKKIPIELKSKRKVSSKILTENNLVFYFNSEDNYVLQAHLIAPKKIFNKPPVIVIFPDYHDEIGVYNALSNAGYAQLVLRLRGHEVDLKSTVQKEIKPEELEQMSYGYFQASLTQKKTYYLKQLYLDAYRTLEVIRLRKEVDTAKIGIWGKGVGAAMALFVTRYMNRTTGLFLEHPSFMNLEVSQNLSGAKHVKEINEYIKNHRKDRDLVKENLNYFDAVYFAQDLDVPTAMVLNLENTEAVPHSGFSAFHCIRGEKEMHIFPDAKPATIKKQKKVTVDTAIDFFNRFLA